MALPNVQVPGNCTDFYLAVLPYVSQLYDLPSQILRYGLNPTEFVHVYRATNPLIGAFAFSLFLAPIFLLVSEINKNYSQVDRCWSILPTLYIAHYASYARANLLSTRRLDNLLVFSAVWSLRLTYNYWRKGGYSAKFEDYRWEVLRQKISPGLFFVFNVLFISLGQSILLFLITTPSYILLLVDRLNEPSGVVDYIFPTVLIGLVIIEWIADQQQWDFQTAKRLYIERGIAPYKFNPKDLDRGFVATGLWSWSRHPNFTAEQAIWVMLYLWSCFVTMTAYNWTIIGAASYLILFQASTWFTELISAGKYPQYEQYQKRVGKFLPKLSGFFRGPQQGRHTKCVEDEN